CVGLLQHADNLLFAEPRFLHDKVSPAASPLTLQWDTLEGEGQLDGWLWHLGDSDKKSKSVTTCLEKI
ncbi:hypothetical protein K6W16_28045, partial [Burkholderia dolosa]|uniref:hypothetical protein n=1 Tax=Burkholderia dolosa TaxID=152500 RepID=UPI001B9BA50F